MTTRAIPGDPLVCCDICGANFNRSQTRKTWDGLRVCNSDWEPKHPLLSIRGKIDRQAVQDARPEPPDRFVVMAPYGVGSFTLVSPNGTHYIVYMQDGGVLDKTPGSLGQVLEYFPLGVYRWSVDDAGAFLLTLSPAPTYITGWNMSSPDGTAYRVTIAGAPPALVVT